MSNQFVLDIIPNLFYKKSDNQTVAAY